MASKKCRIAVLLSGGGTTMVNLQEHILKGEVPAEYLDAVTNCRKARKETVKAK